MILALLLARAPARNCTRLACGAAALPHASFPLNGAFALGDAKPKKFKIYDDDPFSKAFDVFAKLKKGGSFGYSYKARPIPPDATPASLGIRGEGKIDVVAK